VSARTSILHIVYKYYNIIIILGRALSLKYFEYKRQYHAHTLLPFTHHQVVQFEYETGVPNSFWRTNLNPCFVFTAHSTYGACTLPKQKQWCVLFKQNNFFIHICQCYFVIIVSISHLCIEFLIDG